MRKRLARKFYSRRKKLPRNFYTRPTLVVAKDLLGKFIVRKWRGRDIVGEIVEVEAYIGPHDKASHAYKGKITPRNKAEYLIGGHIYIYLVYGMYWQFNISTSFEGKPECVLIRALEPINEKVGNPPDVGEFHKTFCHSALDAESRRKKINLDSRLCGNDIKRLYRRFHVVPNGPGKLCNYLKIDKSFYGEDMVKSGKIWLEDRGLKVKKSEIIATKRIGIDYAQEWVRAPWRFCLKNNKFVSKK